MVGTEEQGKVFVKKITSCFIRNKTLLERLLGRRYVRCILACRLVQSLI